MFSSLIIRRDHWIFFKQDCGSCPNVNTCISSSSLHYSPRQYVLSSQGYRCRATRVMMEGSQMHRDFQKGLLTLDEYGLAFFNNLESGSPVSVRELPICSRLRGGVRGHYDRVSLQKVGANGYRVEVTEFKRSFLRECLNLLIAYGAICSNPNCEVIFRLPSLRKPSIKKTVPHRLYVENPTLDVTLRLRVSSGKEYTWVLLEQNRATEWGHDQIMRLMKLLRTRRRFHRFNITMFEVLLYRTYCKRESNEECPFWNEICSRIPYQLKSLSRRMFFGKRQLLVKSPPKLKLLPDLHPA